jgi:aryl-alcohol dehydrogenase-like predicted oxidoreductase
LSELQQQGKIRFLGITNFDSQRLTELLDTGVNIATNQVQYSLLDNRPENEMHEVTSINKIPFLCYGVLAGGFLTNGYLSAPDPIDPPENRSLVKYRLIIEEFGGYELFQELLKTLDLIAHAYGVSIAEVSMRYMLQKSNVASLIIGSRNRNYLSDLQKINSFILEENHLQNIDKILEKSTGPQGAVYELEREKEGKHGAIMRYNLNEQRK